VQLIKFGASPNAKTRAAILVIFLLIFSIAGMIRSDTAMAKTEYSDPATSLTVVLNDEGEVFELATYSISELESMPQVQREYSSIDRMPAPVFTAGKGLDLATFLSSQGIDLNSISYCRFYATDNIVKKLDRNVLFDRAGYYFPKIVECWDTDWDENSNSYIDVQKVSAGAVPVVPMLAITSSQGRWLDKPDWNNLDGSTCLRLCLGQIAPEECITMNFVRWVYKIEVFGKLQSGGGGSVVAPRATFDKPAADQTYQVGDTVEIAGTVEKMSSVTLTVTDPDNHIVYTVFDIAVKDGKITEEFLLGPDAVPGNYTIEAGPKTGSSLGRKQTFKVVAPSGTDAAAVLTSPEAGCTVQPGNKIKINGSLNGLTSARLEIVGPGEKTVYTGTIDKSGDFSEEFTPAADTVAGDYTIQISGPGMKQNYTRVFKIAPTIESNSSDSPSGQAGPVNQPGTAAAANSLKDISNHWAADRIKDLVARGAIKGYPDGNFRPDATITRAEYTTAVVKAFSLTAANGKHFADTSGHWARDYIAAATAAGIVGGYSDNSFAPDEPITRQQMASMVVKAARLTTSAVSNQFSDNDSIADWAREDVATAVSNQIIKGYPDNTFKPGGKATRAEAAAVIVNALNLLK